MNTKYAYTERLNTDMTWWEIINFERGDKALFTKQNLWSNKASSWD